METRLDRLNKIAVLAKSAPLSDREQIERIMRLTKEAEATTQRTVEVMKRMMNKPT